MSQNWINHGYPVTLLPMQTPFINACVHVNIYYRFHKISKLKSFSKDSDLFLNLNKMSPKWLCIYALTSPITKSSIPQLRQFIPTSHISDIEASIVYQVKISAPIVLTLFFSLKAILPKFNFSYNSVFSM